MIYAAKLITDWEDGKATATLYNDQLEVVQLSVTVYDPFNAFSLLSNGCWLYVGKSQNGYMALQANANVQATV